VTTLATSPEKEKETLRLSQDMECGKLTLYEMNPEGMEEIEPRRKMRYTSSRGGGRERYQKSPELMLGRSKSLRGGAGAETRHWRKMS